MLAATLSTSTMCVSNSPNSNMVKSLESVLLAVYGLCVRALSVTSVRCLLGVLQLSLCCEVIHLFEGVCKVFVRCL